MKRQRPRRQYWKKTGNPLVDNIVCPQCGSNAPGHPPSLHCGCSEGACFSMFPNEDNEDELMWRRSPCACAICDRCGWRGVLRNKVFEQTYRNSRCPVNKTGWHDIRQVTSQNKVAGPLVVQIRCVDCGCMGYFPPIDVVTQIAWEWPPSAASKPDPQP